MRQRLLNLFICQFPKFAQNQRIPLPWALGNCSNEMCACGQQATRQRAGHGPAVSRAQRAATPMAPAGPDVRQQVGVLRRTWLSSGSVANATTFPFLLPVIQHISLMPMTRVT